MTTSDLIKLLQEHEFGAISKKPREISLRVNGHFVPNPSITVSSTGDGIAGPEIDLDIDGTIELGDVTNGDMIKAMFPNGVLHSKETEGDYWRINHPNKVCYEVNFQDLWFDEDWWDAPYRRVEND